jgi:DNA-binding NarL/FixJ family response regulator
MSEHHLDPSELASLRDAAAALQEQDGTGVPRQALVRLADASARYALSVYAGTPAVAVARPLPDPAAAETFSGLTRREREVAALVAAGRSNREIAAELVITVGTVKDHVHRILRKSGLKTRAAVAADWQRAHGPTLAR